MAAPMPEPAYVRAADLNLVSLFYVYSMAMPRATYDRCMCV